MSKEFYKYIAANIIHYFQKQNGQLQPGSRYALKMDNKEMVEGVNAALKEITMKDGLQGQFVYSDSYRTYTIKVNEEQEIVVAAQLDMTDDFLATLRNATLTENRFPILMITCSSKDTITSGTGNLAAMGMPFHTHTIVERIRSDIAKSKFSPAQQCILEYELDEKTGDRFTDSTSLFEYAPVLTVLSQQELNYTDLPNFSLIPDPALFSMIDRRKIKKRLEENHNLFSEIEHEFDYGNIDEVLAEEFDKNLIDVLKKNAKRGVKWYSEITLDQVLESQEKKKQEKDNPLIIDNAQITAYDKNDSSYTFPLKELLFIRDDGLSKAKQTKKNILIFNPECKKEICIEVPGSRTILKNTVDTTLDFKTSGKKLTLTIEAKGSVFTMVQIKKGDGEPGIAYTQKICVLNIDPHYLENIQTDYTIECKKGNSKKAIEVYGISSSLIINPKKTAVCKKPLSDGKTYDCSPNETLEIEVDEEELSGNGDSIGCTLKFGDVLVPLKIKDDNIKSVELTGTAVFKYKHQHHNSLQYCGDNKIIGGGRKFYARDPFKTSLSWEDEMVNKRWKAMKLTSTGHMLEVKLDLPPDVEQAYLELLDQILKHETLPSLVYYDQDAGLKEAAQRYVEAVFHTLESIESGQTLNIAQSNLMLLGSVVDARKNDELYLSPLHPLNIAYQLRLLEEKEVGAVRDNLIPRLSSLNLMPFIKLACGSGLFNAVEQNHSPEWNYYIAVNSGQYQSSRNYIQKLVCDKIKQYMEHFSFLFSGIGNYRFVINLVNMGQCREVVRGLIHFYIQQLSQIQDLDLLTQFEINIYADSQRSNDFQLLGNSRKLKEFLKQNYSSKDIGDISEMAMILSSKISYYQRNSGANAYQYAHLTFYEMDSAEDSGANHMDTLSTGLSLDGLVSGVPSVLNEGWYKTGFGFKYANENFLSRLAVMYNALARVAYTGSSYEKQSSLFTALSQGQEGQLEKIYSSSNWVVFVDPKVDLSFFQKETQESKDLMVIHYSDQYSSASGYDDITVTQKSTQYSQIIREQLQKKGVQSGSKDINGIISLFNAVNGSWLLRLITEKKLAGATDSFFSREKMSILSAIKLCLAWYGHSEIVWIPVSLEEMLRVSGGAGLSQKDGLLSAKNLGFEQRATCDDILLVGIQGPADDLKIYLHPVEVKIGVNSKGVINKAREQVRHTYEGLWNALWSEESRENLEQKLTRNFFIQMVVIYCEKMKLYGIDPGSRWDLVLDTYRQNLLNNRYRFSKNLEDQTGIGTIISFKAEGQFKSKRNDKDQTFLLEMPEKAGSTYMVKSVEEIRQEICQHETLGWKLLDTSFGLISETQNEEKINELQPVEETEETLDLEEILNKTEKRKENEVSENLDNSLSPEETSFAKDESENKDHPVGINITFGTDRATGQPLVWRPNDTNQLFHTNTGIIGTMGTGKTQFTKSLVTQMYRERKNNVGEGSLGILIFDYKGDYNESKQDFTEATEVKVLKPYRLPFNPFTFNDSQVFKPLLPIHTADGFKDILSKIFHLGAKQQNALLQCIKETYEIYGIQPANPNTWKKPAPTFDMVYAHYIENDEIKKNDSLAAAMDKINTFQLFESDPSKTQSLYDLIQGVVVIDLNGYPEDLQNLIVAITLELFYTQMQLAGSSKMEGQFRQLSKMILVDEADNFMSKGFPTLKKILKEGREFGVGTILSTQYLEHFNNGDDNYSKYILTWIVHNVSDLKTSDIEFVFKTDPRGPETQQLYMDIHGLKKHQSIVKIGNNKPRYIEDLAFWQLNEEE